MRLYQRRYATPLAFLQAVFPELRPDLRKFQVVRGDGTSYLTSAAEAADAYNASEREPLAILDLTGEPNR